MSGWRKKQIMEQQQETIDRFDLEQYMLQCWHVVDDVKLAAEMHPEAGDLLKGIAALYDARFSRMFDTFEQLISEGKI